MAQNQRTPAAFKFVLLVFVICISTLPPMHNAQNSTNGTNGTNGTEDLREINITIPVMTNRPAMHHGEACHALMTSTNNNRTVIIGGNTTIANISTFRDPCDLPRNRSFMNCNAITKQCECYRDWGDHPPNYGDAADPIWTSKEAEWFTYDHHLLECMVKTGKKCGKRGEASPYRCQHVFNNDTNKTEETRCVILSEDDQVTYFCSGGYNLQGIGAAIFIFILSLYFSV